MSEDGAILLLTDFLADDTNYLEWHDDCYWDGTECKLCYRRIAGKGRDGAEVEYIHEDNCFITKAQQLLEGVIGEKKDDTD